MEGPVSGLPRGDLTGRSARPMDRVQVYGIRHHGPGSARSLCRALAARPPDIVLVEGPPDAQDAVSLVLHEGLAPPVALLVYVPDAPQSAVFYPFAEFSPEWQAIRYGLSHDLPVRFMDLPQSIRLAPQPEANEEDESSIAADDPLDLLAAAAGYSDGERWWDYLVESRQADDSAIFDAVREAMSALRAEQLRPHELLEQRREAHMREAIRAALRDGFQSIAVVCGAWHAPVLHPDAMPPAKDDKAVLKGLKKVKTATAWAPWTYDRLSYRSGYGAGVASPEWYHLLWGDDRHVVTRWMARAAGLMRDQDLDASSANVIEAVRLAHTLAILRNRPLAGLDELDEAALTVLCSGDPAPMSLIRRRLVVGERLGSVPDEAPMPPVQRDLTRLQKRLRLAATSEVKDLDFDLRKPLDLERSHLLHRLALLGVGWAEKQRARGRTAGTFHEYWQIQWRPELTVALIEASRWGNTVAAAATGYAVDRAGVAQDPAELTRLLDDALLADLPDAVSALVAAVEARSATGSDVAQLMAAVPPLANVLRYGNVRQTDAAMVGAVVAGMVTRVCIGLPGTCAALDDDAAEKMVAAIDAMHGAVMLLQQDAQQNLWLDALDQAAGRHGTHEVIGGRAGRLLYDCGRLDAAAAGIRIGLALSPGADPAAAAAWIDGFLRGSGTVLIHDDGLLGLIDKWVGGLTDDRFIEVLPLVRRTFSTFEMPERRQIGERVKGIAVAAPAAMDHDQFDHERARQVLPLLERLLGVEATP